MSDKMIPVLLLNMCMIYDEEKDLVLVLDKVKSNSSNYGGITFPGGHVENGESIVESTIREVKEETGLDISNVEACGLINWYNSDNHERWLIFLYKTKYFEGELINETKEGKVYWLKKDDLYKQALAPDLKTYLKLFFDENKNEAYATYNKKTFSDFKIF